MVVGGCCCGHPGQVGYWAAAPTQRGPQEQSSDFAGGVHVGKDEMDASPSDQGILFVYASDETKDEA